MNGIVDKFKLEYGASEQVVSILLRKGKTCKTIFRKKFCPDVQILKKNTVA